MASDDDLRDKLTKALAENGVGPNGADLVDDLQAVVREALDGAREAALKDAAITLYRDVTAESGTTKALNHSIYAAWLLDFAKADRRGEQQ